MKYVGKVMIFLVNLAFEVYRYFDSSTSTFMPFQTLWSTAMFMFMLSIHLIFLECLSRVTYIMRF